VRAWLLAPVPLARIAVLRLLVYGFVPVDVLLTTPWVADHGDLPASAYVPLLVGRLLHLPTPTPVLVDAVQVALLVAALAALTGRAPRLLGAAVLALYAQWMVIAMSYGKVDHDRFAYLVALAVLPTVGSAALRSRDRSEAAAFALRCVQLAVVATYFLSAFAKLRFGGTGWPSSGVFTWALLRRGHDWALPMLDAPELLVAAQWGLLVLELGSPLLLLVGDRLRWAGVAGLLGFHLVTFASIGIIFLPHLVAMAALLPLERLVRRRAPEGRAPFVPQQARGQAARTRP